MNDDPLLNRPSRRRRQPHDAEQPQLMPQADSPDVPEVINPEDAPATAGALPFERRVGITDEPASATEPSGSPVSDHDGDAAASLDQIEVSLDGDPGDAYEQPPVDDDQVPDAPDGAARVSLLEAEVAVQETAAGSPGEVSHDALDEPPTAAGSVAPGDDAEFARPPEEFDAALDEPAPATGSVAPGGDVETEQPEEEFHAALDDGTAESNEPAAEAVDSLGLEDAPPGAEEPSAAEAAGRAMVTGPQQRRRERRRGGMLELDLGGGAERFPALPAPAGPSAAPGPARRSGKKRRRPAAAGHGLDFASVIVDRDDDLSTVFGKIDTANSPRVALVTHGGNREMESSRLTLRRLKRYGEGTGKDVVLVSRRWNLRAKARREGVRTAYMTRGIRWGRRRRVSISVPGLGGLARAVVGVGVTLAIFVAAYLVVPGATIKVRPSVIAISKPVAATVSLRSEVADLELGELPATRLKVSLDYSVAVPVTGTKEKPTGTATGKVTFTNPSAEVVTVPAETRIKTAAAVVFLTAEAVDVPSGGTADVRVTALVEGDSGAVGADTIKVLEGDLEGTVSVTNAEATDPSGTDVVPAVSDDDLKNLRTVVVEVVSQRALEELTDANPGDLIFPDTLDVAIVEEQFSSDLGEEANWVTIEAKLSITALAASAADLREMARFWLAEDLNEDEVLLDKTLGAEVVPGSTVEYDAENATVSAQILLEGGIVPTFDPTDLKATIAGKSVEDAEQYLADVIPSLTDPTINRGPGWLPGGIPRFGWRIELIVEPGP